MRAYLFSGPDNDSQIYNLDDSRFDFCPKCHRLKDYKYIPPYFKLGVKKYDVSCTYDNRMIVSRNFKDFCEQNYSGITFTELPNDVGFFLVSVHNMLIVNKSETKIIFKDYCEQCERHSSITLNLPIMPTDNESIMRDEIFATDIPFGSKNGICHIFLVGPKAYQTIKNQKFKGAGFFPFEINL